MNSIYVTRQGVFNGKNTNFFEIYCLSHPNQLVFNSDSKKTKLLTKLVLLKDSQKEILKFYIFTEANRFVFTIPMQSETVIGNWDDIEKSAEGIRKNPRTYHQDWPLELRKTNIDLNGTQTSVDYFLVPDEGRKACVEIVRLTNDANESTVERKVKEKISRGLWQNNKFSEDTSQIDRFDDEEHEVTFPAIIPRRFINDIFEQKEWLDSRKVFESADKKSIIYFCWAGRDIQIATLKPSSQYKTV